MTNEEKARYYDELLREHDKKATEVSNLQNKFDQTKVDQQRIKQLKTEMAEIQRKANNLGSL